MMWLGLRGCFVLAGISVLFFSEVRAQFLSRAYYPLWMEEYENYAIAGYRDALQPIVTGSGTNLGLFSYGTSSVVGYYVEQERSAYDPFGNYLVDGLDIFRLEEFRTLAPDDGSSLFKSNLYNQLFQNLVIAQDTYKSWSSRFIIGDAIRTKFTPLTLDLARMNGIRWDAASRKNRLSIAASKVSDPVTDLTGLASPRVQPFASYLFGGRWESTLGGVLTLGTSFVTMLHIDSRVRDGAGRRGVVPSSLAGPRSVFVIVSDDSPEDGQGALVYDLEIYINGQRSEIVPEVRRIRDLLGSKVFVTGEDKFPLSPEAVSFLRKDRSWPSSVSGYFNVLNPDARAGNVGLFRDGEPVSMERERPAQVRGADLLVFRFEGLPADAKEVAFKALVANDYSIEVASGLGQVEAATLVWDDWHNVERAAGNVQDGSNLGWVSFTYGFPTGVAAFGFDAQARFLGAALNAEVTRNLDYYRFPSREGQRQQGERFAYYAHLTRPFRYFTLGAESFAIPADYMTSLPIWSYDNNGPAFFNLVDDNDDRDEWADAEDLDGVFPGLDADDDGIIDTNVNNNGLPDYLEPFLMYYVDPDDFVFGDDFNHNNVVDARENDNTPDYPYDLDSRGQHLFADFAPREGLRYTIGFHHIRRPAGGGRNRSLYGELEYRRRQGWGTLRLANRTQRVRDDIPDDLAVSSRFTGQGSTGSISDRFSGLEGLGIITDAANTRGGVLDLLSMRNSLVNTAFVQASFTRVKDLNLSSSLRYEINARRAAEFADGTVQPHSTEQSWGFIHRADYTLRAGGFALVPMYKFLVQKKLKPATGRDPFFHAYHLIPILKLDYHFTPSTIFRIGIQGFPGLEERFRERSSPFAEFDALSQVFLLQNKGNYSGFDLFLNMGYRRTEKDFRTRSTSRSVTEGEYFVQVFME